LSAGILAVQLTAASPQRRRPPLWPIRPNPARSSRTPAIFSASHACRSNTKHHAQALDAQTAKKILACDVANLIRRVKQGIPLTAQQRELVETSATESQPKPATATFDSMAQAAAALCCFGKGA